MDKLRVSIKKWLLRYIKYNVIGLSVFMLNIVVYFVIFPYLGAMSYIIVSVNGGIIEFALIAYFNQTKRGTIFDSCRATDGIPIVPNVTAQPPAQINP
jgi:hypothetical protein